ncbi:MAG: hypothetical protein CM1200mP30_33630 [Pseudomonadota bacterium]|nr:MAG: hypothetical protein CM1200mP30_33630 [Pseudomonadota bacterium]
MLFSFFGFLLLFFFYLFFFLIIIFVNTSFFFPFAKPDVALTGFGSCWQFPRLACHPHLDDSSKYSTVCDNLVALAQGCPPFSDVLSAFFAEGGLSKTRILPGLKLAV